MPFRFDLIYLLLDKASETSDRKLARHLVALYGQVTPARARVSLAITMLIDWGSRVWLKHTPLSCQLFGPVSVESMRASWKLRSVQLTWQDQSSISV